MGRICGSLARAGKTCGNTPLVEPLDKPKAKQGRAKKRYLYNKRFNSSPVTIKMLLYDPMSSQSVRGHAPVDTYDGIKFIPPPFVKKRDYYWKERPDQPKYNKGIDTASRERERRVRQIDTTEYQMTGTTRLFSQWGTSEPKITKPCDHGAWMYRRTQIKLPHLPFGTVKLEKANTEISVVDSHSSYNRQRTKEYGPADIRWKDGVQYFVKL